MNLRTSLERGDRLVGTLLHGPSIRTAELVGALGVDFVCVEAEHSALGRETVQALVGAASSAGTPALVRVADNATVEIAGALDAGAAGVIVPRVDSAGEAAGAVRAARLPPLGARGIGPGRATGHRRLVPQYFPPAHSDTAI